VIGTGAISHRREVFVLHQTRKNLGERAVQLGRVVTLTLMISGVRASSMRIESTSSTMRSAVCVAPSDRGSRHVVAEVIEADFVVRDVGDVAVVGCAARRGVEIVLDDADGQAERVVERPSLGVALGQVVVDVTT